MSEDPNADVPMNGTPSKAPELPSGGGESVADLKREVEQLRAQLSKATTEAEMYRSASYTMLERLHPYVPPTEEELHDMMHGPRGRSILEVIEEYEKSYAAPKPEARLA